MPPARVTNGDVWNYDPISRGLKLEVAAVSAAYFHRAKARAFGTMTRFLGD